MSATSSRACRYSFVGLTSAFLGGCAFLPGFSLFETPTLYYLSVAEVANRVACELQDFVALHQDDPAYAKHKWALSQEDVKVVLTLATNEAGNVSFAGINAAEFGFSSLAALIASQTTNSKVVPTLGAKLSLKRAKTVALTFSVSPKPLPNDPRFAVKGKLRTGNCFALDTESPLNSLYLRDWLNNYFETINISDNPPKYQDASITDTILHTLRPIGPPPPLPKQLKIQSVELSTQFTIAADLSAGLTPNILGNGTAFIVPINGLSVGYNPDYAHKIAITMAVCDTTDRFCNSPTGPDFKPPIDLLKRQCRVYSTLAPLLSSVKPPRDYTVGMQTMRCSKSGEYEPYNAPRS